MQEQKTVTLTLHTGHEGEAIASGRSATWMCTCGRSKPLIGHSGLCIGPTKATVVVCPACAENYYVVPDGKDFGPVLYVRQLGFDS